MTLKNKYLLVLECGSMNFKVAVFDSNLRRICERMEPLRYTVRVPERVEFDPDVAWRTSVRLIREACSQTRMSLESVCKVAITSQANTFCALDESGQPLIPFMSWQDQRATREAALLNRRLGARFHQHCSWPRALPGLQASMLLWLRLHRPQILGKIDSLVTLQGYMAMRLGASNIVDHNLAALSGLYSLKTGKWWPVMLKLCGLTERQLPALVSLGKSSTKATLCRELAFAKRASVTLAGNEQSAGAFGNYCSPKTMLVTLGSGLVVYRVQARRRAGPFSKDGCWGPYPGGGYYESVTSKQGWTALDWARARLVMGRDIMAFTELARKAKLYRQSRGPGAEQALFYPAAINTEQAWVGSSEPGERALSVFEGIGFALKMLIRDVLGIKQRLPEVRIQGSGSSNLFWLQLLADILGVRVGRATGDALYGAARMVCSHSVSAAARNGENVMWFEPRETADNAALYERWKQYYPSTAHRPGRKIKR